MKFLFGVREYVVADIVLDIKFRGNETLNAGALLGGADKAQLSVDHFITVHDEGTDNDVDMIFCELFDKRIFRVVGLKKRRVVFAI